MNENGKTAVAFLLGVIAGGVLGIMFAPKSGKETRESLHKYIKSAEEKLARLRHRRDQMDDDEQANITDEQA
ncbi:MAG TPA: YtxH domain-containing protein [Spirochaetota bacterium]|nr:YtxH domain-containing protein [Spirochaetota bacterium]HPH03273.1 YtxH domain-containing protein [Spirochaetota bacterium]